MADKITVTDTKHKSTNIKLFIFAGIAVLVCVIVALTATIYLSNNYAFKVGTVQISKADYSKLQTQLSNINYPAVSSEGNLKSTITETYKLRQAASKFGISTNDNEITAMARHLFNLSNSQQPNNLQLLIAENQIYKINISHIENGDKRVARFNFPFSRYFASGQESPPDGFGNKDLIEADKKYAQDQANGTKAQLSNDVSEPNIAKLIKENLSDTKLAYGYTANRSAIFYYNKNGRIYYTPSFVQGAGGNEKIVLDNLQSGTTDIFTEYGNKYFSLVKGYDYAGVPQSFHFYVLINNPEPKPSINQEISDFINNIKVTTNV